MNAPLGGASPQATTATAESSRTPTGIAGLDALLEGGFPAHRAVLVSGESGTGKSVLALQFIAAGLTRGEPGVYVSVDQKPLHLLRDTARFGWQMEQAVSEGTLTLLDASPFFTASRNKSKSHVPIDARNIATDLSHQVRKTGARRLVIDSITSLVPPDMGRSDAQDHLRSLMLALEDNLECSVLLTARIGSADPQGILDAAEYLASGVLQLNLRRSGWLYARMIFIKKMRGTDVDPGEHAFEIDGRKGIRMLDRQRTPLPPSIG